MQSPVIQRNSLKAWLLAIRPKTLTGAAVPVMIGAALAITNLQSDVRIVPIILCFLFAFIMQIDANFINDYLDFMRGNDDETRLGPRRACAQGWISPKSMRIGIAITTTVACIIGLPLIFYGGWEMILVGAICVLFCFLYTTHLSYIGMGDVLVLCFFGIVPVCLTYYLALPSNCAHISLEVFFSSIACGLVIDTMLIVNNYRDIDNDSRAHKNTLVVMLGADISRMVYLMVGWIACLIGIVFLLNSHIWAFFLPFIYAILHTITYRKICKIKQGKALNMLLGETARNMFIYGILTAIGILV